MMTREQVVCILEAEQAERKSLWYLVYGHQDKTWMGLVQVVPPGAKVLGRIRFDVWEATREDGVRVALTSMGDMVIPDPKDPFDRLLAARYEAEMEAGVQGFKEATTWMLEAVLGDLEEPGATQLHLIEEGGFDPWSVWDDLSVGRELHHSHDND